MRLTSFVVWKSWASNRLRTWLTLLGIALGVAVVIAIHVLDHNTILSLKHKSRAAIGNAHLVVTPRDPNLPLEEVRTQLRATSGVAHVSLRRNATATVQTDKEGAEPLRVSLFGLSPLPDPHLHLYQVAAGEDLSDLDADEQVLIGAELAKKSGLRIGDGFVLAPVAGGAAFHCFNGKRVRVEGAAPEGERVAAVVKGILRHQDLGRVDLGLVVVGSVGLSRRVAPQQLTHFLIRVQPGPHVDKLRQSLETRFLIFDDRSALIGERADERAFRNGIKVLGCLALVLGMLVVFRTLSQSLLERIKLIGLMRCLGASRGSVSWMFIVDGIGLAVGGTVLGALLGLGIAGWMAWMEWTTLGIGKKITHFEIPWWPVLLVMGLGVVFTLLGCAFPLFKARNLRVMQVLQARGLGDAGYLLRGVNVFLCLLLVGVLPFAYLAMTPILGKQDRATAIVLLQMAGMMALVGAVLLLAPKLVQWLGGTFLQPLRNVSRFRLPVFLVTKAMQRSPSRFAASVCGLAVVLVAVLGVKHISYALQGEVAQFGAVTTQDRLYFRGNPVTRQQANAVRSLPGVAHAVLHEGHESRQFELSGLDLESLPGIFEGAEAKVQAYANYRNLIVSERWASLYRRGEGGTMQVGTDGGAVEYGILLVSDASGFFPDEKAWAVTHPRWMRQDFCVDARCVDRLAVTMKPGASVAAVRSAVGSVFPHDRFKPGKGVTDYYLRDVTKDFLMFDALLVLILVLVGVGLLNTMTIAALGRAREIGVLRALGMEERSLFVTFLLEGFVVAGLASLLAIVLGVPLGWVVVEGLNRVAGLQAPFVIPWLFIVLTPIVAVLVGVLSAILPGRRALQIEPADAVRYE